MSTVPMARFLVLAPLSLLALSVPALAHAGEGLGGGFVSGFSHPVLGWDHVVAMVAVGLWGAFLGKPALWILPIAFPLVMTLGAVLGILGVPVPEVEVGIAASAIVLGGLIATAARLPVVAAAVVVGLFAVFHGHAHGTELPAATNAAAYAVGFVLATGLLHLAGIALGVLVRWRMGRLAVRAGGVGIAALGVLFLSRALA